MHYCCTYFIMYVFSWSSETVNTLKVEQVDIMEIVAEMSLLYVLT